MKLDEAVEVLLDCHNNPQPYIELIGIESNSGKLVTLQECLDKSYLSLSPEIKQEDWALIRESSDPKMYDLVSNLHKGMKELGIEVIDSENDTGKLN